MNFQEDRVEDRDSPDRCPRLNETSLPMEPEDTVFPMSEPAEAGFDLDALSWLDNNDMSDFFEGTAVVDAGQTNGEFATSGCRLAEDQGETFNKQLDEAIHYLPNEDKAAYLEAVEQAPNVISTESDPKIFLQFEKNDISAAARRLTTYWRERKSLFVERAFRPMTLDGEGALSNEDLALLRSGYVIWLPPDHLGRPVLWINTMRLKCFGKFHPTVFRCNFYGGLLCMDQEKATGDSDVVLMVNFDSDSLERLQGDTPPFLPLVQRAFPFRLREVHMVLCNEDNDEFLFERGLRFVSRFPHNGETKPIIHRGTTTEVLASLGSSGFDKSCLPTIIGGSWTYENEKSVKEHQLRRWTLELQKNDEDCRQSFSTLHNPEHAVPEEKQVGQYQKTQDSLKAYASDRNHWPKLSESLVADRSIELEEGIHTLPNDLVSEDPPRARARKLDALSSKKKRARRKANFETLKNECTDVVSQYLALKEESARLKQMYNRARFEIFGQGLVLPPLEAPATSNLDDGIQKVIDEFAPTESEKVVLPTLVAANNLSSSDPPEVRARKLDALHSKRKRARRKAKVEALKKECEQAVARNEGLKKENAILKQLVKDAVREMNNLG